MQPNTQQASGYFVWEAPGKPVAVHLSLDVIDRMSAEILRGFGSVPKRGAEVGGLLLGTIEPGEIATIKIEDFEMIPCSYQRGPSFLLADDEIAHLQLAVKRWQADSARAVYAVGFFRSNTRDTLTLAPQDVEHMDQYFPDAKNVALLIKPYASQVSQAGFFVREGGTFPTQTPKEFPFRRRELTGEEPPARRSLLERKPRVREAPVEDYPTASGPFSREEAPAYETSSDVNASSDLAMDSSAFTPDPPAPKRSWIWAPITFIFLLLGVALGFQAALSFAPELKKRQAGDAFSLNLAAGRNGNNLDVRWDRNSPAVMAAQGGVLEITDGDYEKKVALDSEHLHEGAVIYQNQSNRVVFRLDVMIGPSLDVVETVDWTK